MNRLLFRLCALPAFLAASSCSLNSFFVHKVLIETPTRPEAWSGLGPLTYALIWKDQAGAESRAFVEEGAALVVDLARGRPQGILAFPSCEKRAFRPAGALYPFDVKASKSGLPSSEADSLRLSFQSGYAASVAACIEEAGYDPWTYPIEKLKSVPEVKGRDPWTVQPWKVARALIDGAFRISLFPAPVTLADLPNDSIWWAESPFSLIDRLEGGQRIRVPDGIHVLYGERDKLVIEVEDGKSALQRISLFDG